jgi:hypothetical protein
MAWCGWPGAVILLGGVALFIGYTAQQVAQAQEVDKTINAGAGAGSR